VNRKLLPAEFAALAQRCAQGVPEEIMAGIARTESAMYPYAISINYPEHKAHQNGYSGKVVMLKQPHDKTEAIHWAQWYLSKGYTVSVGLVQVNVEMANKLGVKPMTLFEPCLNLAAGAKILRMDYAAALRTNSGLVGSFSLYNSGSPSLGIANGYASTVVKNTQK
jgi:type IV secretion system protein VirB1